MKNSLLVAALIALAVSACGKQEEAKPVELAPAAPVVAAPAAAPVVEAAKPAEVVTVPVVDAAKPAEATAPTAPAVVATPPAAEVKK